MWLDFENDRVEPPITDPKLSELAKTLGKDLPTLEFELIIASRFSRAEMTELYGRKTSTRLHKQFVALLSESSGTNEVRQLTTIPEVHPSRISSDGARPDPPTALYLICCIDNELSTLGSEALFLSPKPNGLAVKNCYRTMLVDTLLFRVGGPFLVHAL